ncbi:MAG TPA: hypothetical protein VKT51_05480 [Candidatus Eremiobacteraceae bacterium]|nr:hypothetical protein [Candidatus Eremiobacteraceae bacterium]
MFTPAERADLRDDLIASARADARIIGAALTGSAAADREDRWSDIDLAFGVAADADLDATIADWTGRMYAAHDAVHHLDVFRGATVYRVFLLANTLQVDLAFSPAPEFGAIAPSFRLIFGTAGDPPAAKPPDAARLIGMGWLYALHARSSIKRDRVWQAEYMVSGLRDHVFALACLRSGVPATEARGIDSLPAEVTTALSGALVRSLDIAELSRAFRVGCDALLNEIRCVDAKLADRVTGAIREMANS